MRIVNFPVEFNLMHAHDAVRQWSSLSPCARRLAFNPILLWPGYRSPKRNEKVKRKKRDISMHKWQRQFRRTHFKRKDCTSIWNQLYQSECKGYSVEESELSSSLHSSLIEKLNLQWKGGWPSWDVCQWECYSSIRLNMGEKRRSGSTELTTPILKNFPK